MLRLPGGSRAGQIEAFDALGAGLGGARSAYVDGHLRHWGGAAPRLPRAGVGPRALPA
ncbi:hypothetical protein [Nocardioides sp. B-3]|uniref:hypothetical protein n=1 Tax=Nocardioides sp. B-3 TaxID=2895565 RepID=UPI002152BCC4|nr:hypothetical protein [Nocardioides sp. B-3]UUZ59670.1 hypothetical protein LP418_00495 [Nocardioides sp. B-3]